ncbi:MAG: DUF2089 domain-containing protein [Candidatus Edwardsbacteria bacterium]
MKEILIDCPICGKKLQISQLHCRSCQTTISGQFALPKLLSLTTEQLNFILVFVKCRGNIKEVEKELGISYPTVRNRLDEIISALGFSPAAKDETVKEILDALERGEISAKEAIEKLKKKS